MNARSKDHESLTSLVGRTVRWRFDDGPVAGKDFEHRFNGDGSVDYRMLGGSVEAKWTRSDKCATTMLTDGVFAISYLATNGYTLSAVLNFESGKLVAFASNEDNWHMQEGTFQLVD